SVRFHLALWAVMLISASLAACQNSAPGEIPQADPIRSFAQLDLERLVTAYPLVIEGVVTGQEPGINRVDDRREPYEIPYVKYELDVLSFRQGDGPDTLGVTISSGSPLKLERGIRYLLFLEEGP